MQNRCLWPVLFLYDCVYLAFSILEVYVDGTGGVSDSIRDMVAGMNYTYMSNETITNEGNLLDVS